MQPVHPVPSSSSPVHRRGHAHVARTRDMYRPQVPAHWAGLVEYVLTFLSGRRMGCHITLAWGGGGATGSANRGMKRSSLSSSFPGGHSILKPSGSPPLRLPHHQPVPLARDPKDLLSNNQASASFEYLPILSPSISSCAPSHTDTPRIPSPQPFSSHAQLQPGLPIPTPPTVAMAVKEHQPLVNHCCTFCCKAVDFGTHDYCGSSYACHRCPN